MTPYEFLILVVAMTALASGLQMFQRRRQVKRLRDLAAKWRLHYSADDRFRLSGRIALQLPVPGAAAVRVSDLLYGVQESNYRYIFRTEYTTGVLRTKTAVLRVATFAEPRERSASALTHDVELTFAPEDLPLVEQYRHLCEQALAQTSAAIDRAVDDR